MIISTTLTGNTAGIIGDALRSVIDQVDKCLVIDTGITDNTLEVAELICGDKLVVRDFRWRDDFSAARNFALRAAEEMKASWCMTLDTDERMIFEPGFNLRQRLEEFKGILMLVQQLDGTYCKERIFRLPTKVRFRGPTHEGLRGVTDGSILTGAKFTELSKTPEQAKAKNERDVRILKDWVKLVPEPRWYFHLGTSYHGLKQYEEAIVAYRKCADFRGWSEESSWACYMAAECYCHLGKYVEAIETCAHGMSLRPKTMELAWLAGYSAYQLKEYESAIAWEKIALGIPADPLRIGFRNMVAQNDGPYEVLYFAHQNLGHTVEAEDARVEWIRRKAARLEAERPRLPGEGTTAPG
jgi:glycosyltransferase involved in cell wall biosynthesis